MNAFNPLADIARSALKSNRLGVHSSLSASKSSKDADGGKSSDGTSKASSSGKMGGRVKERTKSFSTELLSFPSTSTRAQRFKKRTL